MVWWTAVKFDQNLLAFEKSYKVGLSSFSEVFPLSDFVVWIRYVTVWGWKIYEKYSQSFIDCLYTNIHLFVFVFVFFFFQDDQYMCTSVQMPKQDSYIGRHVDFRILHSKQQCQEINSTLKTKGFCGVPPRCTLWALRWTLNPTH